MKLFALNSYSREESKQKHFSDANKGIITLFS